MQADRVKSHPSTTRNHNGSAATGTARIAANGDGGDRFEPSVARGARAWPPSWALPEIHTSSGGFETMRVYAGGIFRLQDHLVRLWATAQYLGLTIPMSQAELGRRLHEAVASSGIQEAIVRVALIPDTKRVVSPSIVVQPVPLPPPELYRRGIRLAVVPTKKFPVAQIDPQSKFSARLGSILAVMDAQLRGADEALFLDELGTITESTASNFGMIKNGAFLAAPCSSGLLAGITWQVLLELTGALKIPVHETPLTRHDVYNADEAFLTSSIKEVLPVTVIDGRAIGGGKPGPVSARLQRAFSALVGREMGLATRAAGRPRRAGGAISGRR